MHSGRTVFAQLMDFLPLADFRTCVSRYNGEFRVRSYSCLDQFLTLAFAQLTFRESLRDIETGLRSMQSRLYHMGFRGSIARSTMAEANEKRDWRIYEDFAHTLISTARELYADEDLGLELDDTVFALDATTIDLCLSLFPWARFRKTKAAIKLHTVLDLRGNIPSFIHVTHGLVADVEALDLVPFEPGAIYIMDRGYLSFARLHAIDEAGAFFVLRGRRFLHYKRLNSHHVDRASGLRSDQTIRLAGENVKKDYPARLRRVTYHDVQENRHLTFLTNLMDREEYPALTIASLYKMRWQVELFFRWIKQHLRIKSFFGTSENAVKTQVWTAIAVYVLVAIVKKRLSLELSLRTILQILSLTLFEKTPLPQLLSEFRESDTEREIANQLLLFDL